MSGRRLPPRRGAPYAAPVTDPHVQPRERVAGWLRARPLLVDTVIAVVILAVSIPSLSSDDALETGLQPGGVPAVLLTVGMCLPLAVRRRWPMVALALVSASTFTFLVCQYAGNSVGLGTLVVVYTAAAYCGRNQATVALLVGLGSFVGSIPFIDEDVTLVDVVAVFGAILAAYAFGRSIGFRRAYTAELELRARRLEEARVSDVRAVAAEERTRIARELHDVVAHHVSVMTVQASAARRTLTRNPEAAGAAMEAVEDTGRAALVEMRRIVGVLRADGEHPDSQGLMPQPGVADLAGLVEQVRDAGLRVDMVVSGEPRPLAPGLDLVVYRVVQEALTNTLKHAGPAGAAVSLDYRRDTVRLRVEDDGRGAAARLRPPDDEKDRRTGHGLLGMRERVALYGGTLQVGPVQGGGFSVSVILPAGADGYAPAEPLRESPVDDGAPVTPPSAAGATTADRRGATDTTDASSPVPDPGTGAARTGTPQGVA